jgi:hypothetical protein
MLVAGVSLYVALRATRSSNNQKVAEFRQHWLDDLREHVSLFVGAIYETLNHTISPRNEDNRQRDLDTKHSELRRLESFVTMKLNSHEHDHRTLINLVAQARGSASVFSINPTHALALQMDELIDLIIEFSKLIYKAEWDRVRDDTYGRGRINRFVRSISRKLKRRKREAAIRASASAFFSKVGISTQGAV